VQILVTVAIIQIKNLKIEAEKGFKRTLFELELVDPNLEINFVKDVVGNSLLEELFSLTHIFISEKGKYFK